MSELENIIANLGYPVGMGMAPSPADLALMKSAIIEECAKAIDEAALEADNGGWSACDYSGYLRSLKDKP